MLATAASGQDKHHHVYPGTRTVRGPIWDRLGGVWRLTEDALLKSERLRFNRSHNEPGELMPCSRARSLRDHCTQPGRWTIGSCALLVWAQWTLVCAQVSCL